MKLNLSFLGIELILFVIRHITSQTHGQISTNGMLLVTEHRRTLTESINTLAKISPNIYALAKHITKTNWGKLVTPSMINILWDDVEYDERIKCLSISVCIITNKSKYPCGDIWGYILIPIKNIGDVLKSSHLFHS